MDLSPNRILVDVARAQPDARRFLAAWGIPPTAPITLAEAAITTGLSWDLFQEVLAERILGRSLAETAEPWKACSLLKLVRHLLFRHHEYTRALLNRLDNLWDAEGNELGHDRVQPLQERYHHLAADLEAHLAREETTLFPLILEAEDLQRTGAKAALTPKGMAHPIKILRWEHNAKGDELTNLRRMLEELKSTPTGSGAPEGTLAALRELELDLATHAYLEDRILFRRLEQG